ncbi:MAG: small ribosomal subunit Rsm22 family protein [Verrucomicrobiota bacterium]
MDPSQLDWPALDRLREIFLRGAPLAEPYWRGAADLAAYDPTFGERIGWKWDAALGELRRRGWRPAGDDAAATSPGAVLDWGCGSGVAGRRVVAAWGAENVSVLRVWDHSSAARTFASGRARTTFPGLAVEEFLDDGKSPVGLLVLSHVMNELTPAARAGLLALVARARAILWVEPGTPAVSRELVAFRERLRGEFSLIAPCPHAGACGLLAPGNERHWCHFFAPPPPGLQADSGWVKFGQRAGIDLRSLPYSWLALERSPAFPPPAGASRVLGRVERFKGYLRVLSCGADGRVEPLEMQKRTDPALFRRMERTTGHPPYRWQRDADGRITGATEA